MYVFIYKNSDQNDLKNLKNAKILENFLCVEFFNERKVEKKLSGYNNLLSENQDKYLIPMFYKSDKIIHIKESIPNSFRAKRIKK